MAKRRDVIQQTATGIRIPERIAAEGTMANHPKIIRPSWDEYFLGIAQAASTRGTCIRRRVGCILVNKKHKVIGTGYNGNQSKAEHCITNPCAGATFASGQGLDLCEAIHAEVNAVLRCKNPFKIYTAYITCSPCISCVKLLLATSCKRIVFTELYPSDAKDIWLKAGREWIQIPE